jgi:hypothetical protein
MDIPLRETRDWPLWWFARLNSAVNRKHRGDLRESLQNLSRLGFEVRFTVPPELSPERDHDCASEDASIEQEAKKT